MQFIFVEHFHNRSLCKKETVSGMLFFDADRMPYVCLCVYVYMLQPRIDLYFVKNRSCDVSILEGKENTAKH